MKRLINSPHEPYTGEVIGVSGEGLRGFYAALIVAIVIQSVWIGGGFGSGREIVEFIARYGVNAWIAIVVGSVFLFIALYLSFEVARVFKAYDYMTWSKQFLWRFWPIFDILYIIMAWIVIAVVGAAAGFMVSDLVGIPFPIAAAIVIIVVGLLHFFGRRALEAFWVIGTIGLYAMYIILWAYVLYVKGGESLANLSAGLSQGTIGDAFWDGVRYTMYNLVVVIPALAFVDRFRSRMDSVIAAIASIILVYGAAAMIWLCFMAYYPKVIDMTVPWYEILRELGVEWLLAIYIFWIFYTLIETALGMIYGIIRRVDAHLRLYGRGLTRTTEAILAGLSLLIAIVTAQVGLVALVAKGYGTMAYGFLLFYFLPLLVIGTIRLRNPEWRKEFWAKV
jgi:uncharacterized membrane protein YkvI